MMALLGPREILAHKEELSKGGGISQTAGLYMGGSGQQAQVQLLQQLKNMMELIFLQEEL